jgi:hypothetical protein
MIFSCVKQKSKRAKFYGIPREAINDITKIKIAQLYLGDTLFRRSTIAQQPQQIRRPCPRHCSR